MQGEGIESGSFQPRVPSGARYLVPVAEDTPKPSLGVAPLVSERELRVPRPNWFGRAGPGTFRSRDYFAARRDAPQPERLIHLRRIGTNGLMRFPAARPVR